MIELWPAIDLIDATSVRLTEGKYDSAETMLRTAEESLDYYSQFDCVKRIHIVDLIGAKTQQAQEYDYIKTLRSLTSCPIEVGGGIRTEQQIRDYFKIGIDYCIVGTKAIQDLSWLTDIAHTFPQKIYVSIDAFGTEIKVNGWEEATQLNVFDVIKQMNDLPLGGVIYTDISKDGKLNGPNFTTTEQLVKTTALPIIASGGIRHQKDIQKLNDLNVYAAIVGKAAHQSAFWEGLS